MQSFIFGSKFYKEYTAHDANQFHIRICDRSPYLNSF